jgi:type II restriction enzyme
MLSGNKGEWSELYAFIKLLGEGTLHPGDGNIEKLTTIFYPIIKILRTESLINYEYQIDDNLIFISSENGNVISSIPISKFKNTAALMLKKIQESKESSFNIPELEEFLKEIKCATLKASSTSKTDITIVIHDFRTNQSPSLGFSIKSQLGSPSTLLNAGKTTNFIYKLKINSLSDDQISEINSLDKIRPRLDKLYDLGASFKFIGVESNLFKNNLILIDSQMPEILGQTVFDYYTTNRSKTIDLTNYLEERNPLLFDKTNDHNFYLYKLKRFLTDVALGMTPSKVWTGKFDATGGYIIVKADGDILCYHIYNRNEFEDYLVANTKLDTASTTRHEFGFVFKDNGDYYIKLNLQIRFIK